MKKRLATIIALMLCAVSLYGQTYAFLPDAVGCESCEEISDSADSVQNDAWLTSVISGYKFQYYTTAAIYEGKTRVYSKPSGAFTVYWRIYADDSATSGVLYSVLYERLEADGVEILRPLEIHSQVISGLSKANVLSRPVAKTEFENVHPDRAYIVKSLVVDLGTIRPVAVSYHNGIIDNYYNTFCLDDTASYFDQDGN